MKIAVVSSSTRMLMFAITMVALLPFAAGCRNSGESEITIESEALARALDVHGGLDVWRGYRSLEYDFVRDESTEHHTIDLINRKILITGPEYSIGFDGELVWVSPQLDAYGGNPRFYSSLNFYFFAVPFVFADPGTIRESIGQREHGERVFDAVQISYEDNVGDSPKDIYVPHFDSATGQLEMLLYTVTYRSQEVSETFNARVYEEWQERDGLLVPAKMGSYRWDNEADTLGARRGAAEFRNVTFSRKSPASEIFSMPEGAEQEKPRGTSTG